MAYEFLGENWVVVRKAHPTNPLHSKEVRVAFRRWRMKTIQGERIPEILITLGQLETLEKIWDKNCFLTTPEIGEDGEQTGCFWVVDLDALRQDGRLA